MGKQIRLLLVEDMTVVREGLKRLLETQPGTVVVGEASSVQGAVQQAQQLQPDVILLDLKLGDESGIDAAKAIRTHYPEARILVLSAYDDLSMIEQAIASGVLGYAPKLASFEELMEAIETVAQGRRYSHPLITEKLMEGIHNHTLQRALQDRLLEEQEIALLRCISEGLSYRDIAASLYSSERSVRRHIDAICRKLGVDDRIQAVSLAFRNQWL